MFIMRVEFVAYTRAHHYGSFEVSFILGDLFSVPPMFLSGNLDSNSQLSSVITTDTCRSD